ncbi:MAG: hypothetical protein ACYSWP_25460, partial [Planctomycetota bacterium]
MKNLANWKLHGVFCLLTCSLGLYGCDSTPALKTDSKSQVVAGTHLTDDLILIEDFESESYGKWTAEGDAFGKSPIEDDSPGSWGSRFAVSRGRGLGTLTSPPFTINRNAVYFL